MKHLLFGDDPINVSKSRPNLILVLGQSGTGKTTQCKLIAKTFDCYYFSINEFIPFNQSSEPDKFTIEQLATVFYNILNKTKKNKLILLEGFPQLNQKFVTSRQGTRDILHIVGVLYFHCSEEIMKYRLYTRIDNPITNIDNIYNAMFLYKLNDTLLTELEADGKIMPIDSSKSIELTFQLIIQAFKENEINPNNIRSQTVPLPKDNNDNASFWLWEMN